MRDAMFSSPSPLKDQLIRAGSLPRLLTRFLLAWLALSAVAIGNASADDTIIVIPTVNSFRVTSPEPLLQTLKIGPVVARSDILARGDDIMTALGKAIIVLVDLEITETGDGSTGYEIRLSSEIYEPASQQLVASWAVPNTTLIPPAPCAAGWPTPTL